MNHDNFKLEILYLKNFEIFKEKSEMAGYI